MANEYATDQEFKSWIGIDDNIDDANINIALESASRQIDAYTGRRFYATTETRRVSPLDYYGLFVDDLLSVTSIAADWDDDGVYEEVAAPSDYRLGPPNAPLDGRPYTTIQAVRSSSLRFPIWPSGVQIAGSWGYCQDGAHPAPIKQATLIQAVRLVKRKDTPFGVAGGGEFGEARIIPGGQFLGMDKDAEALLLPFVKVGGV